MPTEYGGAGLGVTEAALMMQTIACSAGVAAAVSTVHINIFGPHAIVVHGTPEQRARMLPPLIRGEQRACFGVTEPDAGLDTSRISTRAVRGGRPIRRARPEDVDQHRTGSRQDRADRAYDADGAVRQAHGRAVAVLR